MFADDVIIIANSALTKQPQNIKGDTNKIWNETKIRNSKVLKVSAKDKSHIEINGTEIEHTKLFN